MQAPPAFQITVRHFRVWRALLACLGCAVSGVVIAWGWAMFPLAGATALAACTLAVGLSLASLGSLLGIQPYSLRWDTQAWWLGRAAERGHEPMAGQLAVAIDWGAWMLLRYTPADSQGLFRRSRWLPIQRAGHESAWLDLRTAVHATPGLPAAQRPAD